MKLVIGGRDRSEDYEWHTTAHLPGQPESCAVYMNNVRGVQLDEAAELTDEDGTTYQGHVQSVATGRLGGVDIRRD